MIPTVMAHNEKADRQIEQPAKTQTPIEEGDAITRNVAFADVRHLIEASRPLRRPNRNRPNALLPDVASALDAIDDVYTERVFGPKECDELRSISQWPTAASGRKLPPKE